MADPPESGPSTRTRTRPAAATAKPRSRAGGRKGQKKAIAQDTETIDLTFDDEDEGQNPIAGPSTPLPPNKLINGVQSRAGSSASYTPTAFTPLPRSLLSGANIRFSPELTDDQPQLDSTTSSDPSDEAKTTSQRPPSPLTGDIFIEEIPRSSENPSDKDGSKHFDPPGLFSTSLMPTVTESLEGEKKVELHSTSESTGKSEAKETDRGLLLPTHVLVESHVVNMEDSGQDEGEAGGDGDDPMEGVHFVDDDISKGSRRYFDPEEDQNKDVEATFLATADQSKICQNCKRPGHRSKDCTHIICTTCGVEDQHERKDCPVGLVCFGCGTRGHRRQDCPNPNAKYSKRSGCDRCGSWDHMENICPTIWRVYSYRSAEKRRLIDQEKSLAVGWEKEAVGGAPNDLWCYNCAREGHLGDDCRERRGSLAQLRAASAFSNEWASRGPHASSSSRSSRNKPKDAGTPTHARWDDSDSGNEELPHLTGFKAFGGSQAGKKSREKAKAKAAHHGQGGESDEESWFDKRGSQGGLSVRGKGQNRGRGMSTPINNQRGAGARGRQKPWDSEYRERERDRSKSPPRRRGRDDKPSPFGHSHLMSRPTTPASAPAKVISFGTLSAPGSRAGAGSRETDSPITFHQTRSGQSGHLALVNRALGLGSGSGSGGSTPKNKDKNQESNNALSGSESDTGSGSESLGPWHRDENGEILTYAQRRKNKRKRVKENRAAATAKEKEKDRERDWENEWRKSGNGGGNVANWGKEMGMDKDERQSNTSTAQGHAVGGAGGGGFSIKGRAANGNSNSGGSSTPNHSNKVPNVPNPYLDDGPSTKTNNSNRATSAPNPYLVDEDKSHTNGNGNGTGKRNGKSTGQRYHGGY